MRLPPRAAARRAFVSPDLAPGGAPLSVLMFVDYSRANCGPYRELLFIPGLFRFSDGARYPSVSRILVSTLESVVNGRRNWGLAKERAEFDVAYADARGDDCISLDVGGRRAVDLRLRAARVSVPVTTRLVPRRARTLAQRLEGSEYFVTPSADALVSRGRVLSWRFEPALFPDVSEGRVLFALKIVRFRMIFPRARVLVLRPH